VLQDYQNDLLQHIANVFPDFYSWVQTSVKKLKVHIGPVVKFKVFTPEKSHGGFPQKLTPTYKINTCVLHIRNSFPYLC